MTRAENPSTATTHPPTDGRSPPLIFASLTRISDMAARGFSIVPQPRSHWATGDYVAAEVLSPQGAHQTVELVNGRHRQVERGDIIVGALGKRHATLEATGTWERVEDGLAVHLLTAAGLIGKCTSRSPYLSAMTDMRYVGHAVRGDIPLTMQGAASIRGIPTIPFTTPVVLIVGTSMSAGKTSAATKIIRRVRQAGLTVTGAKLTGAGRQRDILSFRDAGAHHAYSFVDVGLPSTIVTPDEYREVLPVLLATIERDHPDVAVIEIGSSPLEPYNGDIAIEAIKDQVRATVLCASDPYAVLGAVNAFGRKPTFVTGIATNTLAGVELVKRLSGVPAMNLFNPENIPKMWTLLSAALSGVLPVRTGSTSAGAPLLAW